MMNDSEYLDDDDEEAGDAYYSSLMNRVDSRVNTAAAGGRKRVPSSEHERNEMNERDALEGCVAPMSLAECLAQPMTKLIMVAVLAGLVAGVEAGNAMFSIRAVSDHFGLSVLSHSGLITASILGGTCGGLVGGMTADFYGRKFALVLTSMALLPTALTATVAESIVAVTFERFIAAAVAISAAASSIAYTFELAPTHRRGAAPTAWGAGAVGGWVAVRLAAIHSKSNAMRNHGWRVVGGCPHLVLAIALLSALCTLPESPKWLASRGKLVEARRAIRRLYDFHLKSGSKHFSRSSIALLRREMETLPECKRESAPPQHPGNAGRDGAMQQQHAETAPGNAVTTGPLKVGTNHPDSIEASKFTASPITFLGAILAEGRRLVSNASAATTFTVVALQKWRPVLSLLSSICTASHSAGGLQVLYWGSKVTAPLLMSPVSMDSVISVVLVLSSSVTAALAAGERIGRRPLVVASSFMLVGGSLLLAVVLISISGISSDDPDRNLKWSLRLRIPGTLAAASCIAGWQALVVSLLPLLVCEATPTAGRARAMALLTATSAVYAPMTLYSFSTYSTMVDGSSDSLGSMLLVYACSAGLVLLFLVSALLVETSGKEPNQIRQETINRAGLVLFKATSWMAGTICEPTVRGASYQPVSTSGNEDSEESKTSNHEVEDIKASADASVDASADEVEEETRDFGVYERNGRIAGAVGSGLPSSTLITGALYGLGALSRGENPDEACDAGREKEEGGAAKKNGGT